MTYREGREYFRTSLEHLYSPEEIRELYTRLLAHVGDRSWSSILAEVDSVIPSGQEERLQELLQRLIKGEPYQYLLGYTEFYGHQIKVNKHTLIPRPETEELVDLVNIQLPKVKSIVDIGTGSGCIAIALAGIYPDSKVTAVEISAGALELAEENARWNKVDVEFLQMDFLHRFPEGKFDLIVSNPPYIPSSEKEKMEIQVTDYEPSLALFTADEDPLIFYRRIAEFAQDHLTENGKVFLEIHQKMGEESAGIFRERGWSAEVLPDLSGNDRFLVVG